MVTAAVSSAANLSRHITSHHPGIVSKYRDAAKVKRAQSQKCVGNISSGSGTQTTISQHMQVRGSTTINVVTKKELDKLVTDFLVSTMQPLSLVENPEFVKLMTTLQKHPVMNRKQVKAALDHRYDAMILKLKDVLGSQMFLCAIADCWSAVNGSFIGMTIHWLQEDTLQRKSAVLACSRIFGRHTHDVLAKEMSNILRCFRISHKVLYNLMAPDELDAVLTANGEAKTLTLLCHSIKGV
jgi:hypothetical protein